jgi:hypothetical protein
MKTAGKPHSNNLNKMIKQLPTNSIMISDTKGPEDEYVEPQIIVSKYDGDGSIGLISYTGDEVYIPARMVGEVIKAIKQLK